MGVHEGRSRLSAAFRDLRNRWSSVHEQWRDDQAQRVEREVMQPLEADLKAAMTAMEQLDRILSQVRRECE